MAAALTAASPLRVVVAQWGPGAARVQRVQKVQNGRFLRLTGPPGQRVLRFDGRFASEGCGIALRAMSI